MPHTRYAYVKIGRTFQSLCSTQLDGYAARDLLAELRQAIIGYDLQETAAAAMPINGMIDELNRMERDDARTFIRPLEERKLIQLHAVLASVAHVLQTECSKHEIVFLHDSNVPGELRHFPPLIRTYPRLQMLLDECVSCFRVGLPRSAIVAAWAMGFDYIRTWVHTAADPLRLQTFNKMAGRNPRFTPISEYEHFERVGEREFLEVCRDANDEAGLKAFTSKIFEQLTNLLHQRNTFAHANGKVATTQQAQAFAQNLIHLLESAPFNSL